MKENELVSANGDALTVGGFGIFLIERLQQEIISEDTTLCVLESIDRHKVQVSPVRRAWLAPMNSMLVISHDLNDSPVIIDSGLSLNSDMSVADILQYVDECLQRELITVNIPIAIFHSLSMNRELNILRAKDSYVPLGGGAAVVSPLTYEQYVEAIGVGKPQHN